METKSSSYEHVLAASLQIISSGSVVACTRLFTPYYAYPEVTASIDLHCLIST